jgi:hypothetical protein
MPYVQNNDESNQEFLIIDTIPLSSSDKQTKSIWPGFFSK